MASKLPPEAEAIRQRYARIVEDKVVTPLREDLEARRQTILKELHSVETSSDPRIAEDKRMMELGLEKQLNRVDMADRGLEFYQREFEQLGSRKDDPEPGKPDGEA